MAKPKRPFHCPKCSFKTANSQGMRAHYRIHPAHQSEASKRRSALARALHKLPTKTRGSTTAPSLRFCVTCGHRLLPTWTFCGSCGTRRIS